MHFLVNRWRRIGTRLYLALGFAVLLTLVSSAVGVYYFERSGDLNYQVRSESVPALEATWSLAHESERLRVLGLGLLVEPGSGSEYVQTGSVDESLERLETALATVGGVQTLAPHVSAVQDAAYGLAEVIDELAVHRDVVLDANAAEADLRARLGEISGDPGSAEVAAVLGLTLRADDEKILQDLWDKFAGLTRNDVDTALGEQVYVVRGQQLALRSRSRELAMAFDEASAVLDGSVSGLLAGARTESSSALESSVRSFDEGRVLLAAISIASVVVATLTAWLWVGQGVLKRLFRLSERMRGMAGGDLETPMPEVQPDEIGELAGALEVWRQQALEVQRLNLVERLYGELREANEELQRMQDRLVAQEKLAALGGLVSGVAHEMSNPLNFVKNFTEGSLELYGELTEVLDSYRDQMSEEDLTLVKDIGDELMNSLRRIQSNEGRASAIVERMRGLGVVGGELVPLNLNEALRPAVQAAYDSFRASSDAFAAEIVFHLDDSLGPVPLVQQDFSEAVVNLVSNACYAMRTKQDEQGDSYGPLLTVSSQGADGVVEVRIRDNGTGISEDVVGKIFDPFFSTRDGALGAGLGLPIAADVARRAGGDLSVDSVFGEYAEFTMSLPAESADEDG